MELGAEILWQMISESCRLLVVEFSCMSEWPVLVIVDLQNVCFIEGFSSLSPHQIDHMVLKFGQNCRLMAKDRAGTAHPGKGDSHLRSKAFFEHEERSAESARAALATPAVHSDSSAAPVDLQITDHEKVAQLVFGRNRVVLDFHRIYPNAMPEEVLVNVELFVEADDGGHISLFEVVNIAAWR